MLEDRTRLIVGLGNPGEKYQFTRHNIGFMVVDHLAQDWRLALDKQKFDTAFGRGKVENLPVILAKPMTFMNRVGPAVRNLAHFFRLETQDITVIHDDLDLVFGTLKIKEKGGDGGHNGVKSLIAAFGTDAFTRIRIGIGRPQDEQEITNYVLSKFDAKQEGLIQDIIMAGQDAVEIVLSKGVSEAMDRFHGKKIPESNVGRKL
ncbi:MAG: aminoacyl-tRNA hydrolase [Deltaproteobacteria bacterium]|jgi:PTH1 family peptidyl-tRNA hydrolase|nr:aminoacyl-tRNA hydrolase [Deltaproteobacteria bacterium]MBW2600980.1 aminoacyl-tRNA hydrolase [Deltaproteobacteria bacterium]